MHEGKPTAFLAIGSDQYQRWMFVAGDLPAIDMKDKQINTLI